MKLLATTLFLIALSTSTVFGALDKPTTKTLNEELQKQVNYPEFAKSSKLNGTVRVQFEVNSRGELVVSEMNASCPEFAKYVEERLQTIQVTDAKDRGTHFVKFNFKYVET